MITVTEWNVIRLRPRYRWCRAMRCNSAQVSHGLLSTELKTSRAIKIILNPEKTIFYQPEIVDPLPDQQNGLPYTHKKLEFHTPVSTRTIS